MIPSPDATGYEVENAIALAQLSRQAYGEPPPGATFVDAGGMQAFVASDDHCCVAAFRGTELDQPDDVNAVMKIRLVEYGDHGRVHHGFLDSIGSLWPR